MNKKYTFHVEETNEGGKVVSTKMHTFTTDSDTWSGFEGPMYNFFNFLKSEGYLFSTDAEIGVYGKFAPGQPEEFRSAMEF